MSLGLPVADAVIWGVITFSLLVVLHEGGHFLAARAFGVKVHEFMIGLPGPAIRFRGRKTTFGVTAVPLGGYVRIAGMEPGPEDPLLARALGAAVTSERVDARSLASAIAVEETHAARLLVTLQDYAALEAAPDDKVSYLPVARLEAGESADELLARLRSETYRGKKTWQRVTILSMGVVVNLVTAVLVFTAVLSVFGYFELSLKLDSVVPGSGAEAAGLEAGDEIVAVEDERVRTFQDLVMRVGGWEPGGIVTVEFVRDGRPMQAEVTLGEGDQGQPLLGVQPSLVKREFGLGGAFVESLRFVGLVFRAIAGFFNPETFRASLQGASSVVGASVIVAEAARTGPIDYAWIVALLSLSLGALNLVPIPPLDGGKIAVEAVERVIGHPLRREVSFGLSIAGAMLLFSLIGYLVYADVLRLANG
ncbi:MAG: site-2 protease family protein [Coriobacteriia bacterium]|nr:site-2 protease family protein [Coriobacteriia bacterium]